MMYNEHSDGPSGPNNSATARWTAEQRDKIEAAVKRSQPGNKPTGGMTQLLDLLDRARTPLCLADLETGDQDPLGLSLDDEFFARKIRCRQSA